MNELTWRYAPIGEGALLLEVLPSSPLANRWVVAFSEFVAGDNLRGIESIVPAISSLMVVFDPLQITFFELRAYLDGMRAQITPAPEQPDRVLRIPVCYGGNHGPDLAEVATTLDLRPEQVVALHTGQIYRVMMVGFAPGFAYIGPLPAALNLPRRSTPRTAVPAGSVAIAAGLTGIYPARLPGGWHLIGRTERTLFDPAVDPPALLHAGDGVQFVPVDEVTP